MPTILVHPTCIARNLSRKKPLESLWHNVRTDAVILGLSKTLYDIPRVKMCVIKCLRIFFTAGIGTNIVPQTFFGVNFHTYGRCY